MIQFSVIIPFRPKAESIDWVSENQLLNQTVASVLRQSYPLVSVYVVYTDKPIQQVSDDRVHYLLFPYGYKFYDQIPNREELLERFKGSAKMVVRRWDKARKLCYGCMVAKDAGADYLMGLDADDLLSNRLFGLLAASSKGGTCPGWCMEQGYLYKPPGKFLYFVPYGMRALNGSTNVLHVRHVQIPDFNSNKWEDYQLFTDHGSLRERIRKGTGEELIFINQPLLVYVVHGSNISVINKKEFGFHLKAIIKRLLRFRMITKQLKAEFGL